MDILSAFSDRLSELMLSNNITTLNTLSLKVGVCAETVRLWKSEQRYINLSHLVKLADFFNCSIDFLTGRTDEKLNFTPCNCPPFYERLRVVMKEKKISRYFIVKNTRIYDSYFTNWKNGADIHVLTLVLLADLLDCSVDYLVGREQ